MAVYKNKAGQKVACFAYDATDGSPKTGDASNITAQISKDGGATAATNDTNPTELDATDAPGIYLFDLTQSESNADLVVIAPVSSTESVLVEPLIIYTEPEQRTALLAATTHSGATIPTVTSVGSVSGAVGSVTGNVGGNVVGSVASVVGNVGGNVSGSVASVVATVDANLVQVDGDPIPTPDNAGVPIVQVAYGLGGDTLYPELQEGTDSTTLVLDGESDQDDYLNGWLIPLPEVGQVALVTDYDGSTQVATVVNALTGAALDPAPAAGEHYGAPALPALDVLAQLTAIKGATFNGSTDSLEAIRDRGDSSWVTATGFSTFDPDSDTVNLKADQSGVTIGTVNTLDGHTPQTGDSYALAAGSDGFAATKGVVDALPSASTIAAEVWGTNLSSYEENTAGYSLSNIEVSVDAEAVATAVISSLDVDDSGQIGVYKVGPRLVAPATQAGGNGTTTLVLDASEPPGTAAWVGRRIHFPATGQVGTVASYDGSTKTATFAAAFSPSISTAGDVAYEDYGEAPDTIARAVLLLDWTGITSVGRNALNALRKLRNRYALPAPGEAAATVYLEDDATPAYTEAVTQTDSGLITDVDPSGP